jgi:hypothetical protein
MGIEQANSRTTRFRRDLVLLNISLLIVGLTLSFLIVGLLIFEEWQRQVDAFHLSIKEYAESLWQGASDELAGKKTVSIGSHSASILWARQ